MNVDQELGLEEPKEETGIELGEELSEGSGEKPPIEARDVES